MSRRRLAFCRTVLSRTAASLDGGSSSPGLPDRCSWRCYSAETGLLLGYRPPQTPASKDGVLLLQLLIHIKYSYFLINVNSLLVAPAFIFTSLSSNSQYCKLAACATVRTQAYVLLYESSHTQSGKHSCRDNSCVTALIFCDYCNNSLFVARRASPRPRGPAEGRLGLKCCFLLPHIPPVYQISTCCCSLYWSETQRHAKSIATHCLFIT